MARWYSSDWHLGHANVIRFCDRPARTADHMNQLILDAVNDRVGPDDELWILGDLALGDIEKTLALVRSLIAGHIVLVAGNHDRVHPYSSGDGTPKQERWLAEYRDRTGITDIRLGDVTLRIDPATGTAHETGLAEVTVSHFPFAGAFRPFTKPDGSPGTDKYARWRPVDNGQWLLCGHVHEAWQQKGRMLNVGIDAWAGRPVSEADIAAALSTGPRDLPADRWV